MNSYRKWWLIALGTALVLATLSPLASGSPDGLERVAEDHEFIDTARAAPFEIIADYVFPGIQNEALATILAGWIGVLILFALMYAFSWLITRKQLKHKSNSHEF
ncbi:MAG: PDGLE domain-containing protein [Dehalogenimonas sp.]|uniref:PDGLE domain-containing protein n=1 Tax=Candidatus Dehalogenimonas loeffleri TaxID=3127115 RepID=A0ABZ2J8W3_9CHLR|nr:PDGLE domain-containing protein [Dehalogenimonas sp.]